MTTISSILLLISNHFSAWKYVLSVLLVAFMWC
jgi:hypothetical protein